MRTYQIKMLTYGLISVIFLFMFRPYDSLLLNLRNDCASYLSHGFTLGLDFNFQYKGMIANWLNIKGGPAHPIGPGLLAAPFIALFSIIDRITASPVILDHHQYHASWSFFGFIFATYFYFIAGLWLYINSLKILSIRLSARHFIFLASSFGLLVYVLTWPIHCHAYEFFTIALCFWSTVNSLALLLKNKIPYHYLMLCALSMILTLIVRPANINIFLLPSIIFGFATVTNAKYAHVNFSNRQSLISLSILVVWVFYFLGIMFAINQSLYGMIYPSSEALYGKDISLIPHLQNSHDFGVAFIALIKRLPTVYYVFFSSEFGIVFNSSFLFFGTLIAFWMLSKHVKRKGGRSWATFFLMGIYVAMPLALVLFWQAPANLYGYRFLFCVFPIALLGFASWYSEMCKKYGTIAQFPTRTQCFIVIFWLLGAFGLVASLFWGLNNHLFYRSGPNAFGIHGPMGFGIDGKSFNVQSAVGYNFAVLEALVTFSTWYELFITRTIGFYYVGLLELFHINPANFEFYQLILKKIKAYNTEFYQIPARVYAQVTLLGLFYIGSMSVFCRQDFKSSQKYF